MDLRCGRFVKVFARDIRCGKWKTLTGKTNSILDSISYNTDLVEVAELSVGQC